MGFNEAVTGMNAAHMAAFGQSITYTPSDGVPVEATAIVDLSARPQTVRNYGARWAKVSVLESEIASPEDGASVVIGSDTYTARIDHQDFPIEYAGGMWSFWASLDERRMY